MARPVAGRWSEAVDGLPRTCCGGGPPPVVEERDGELLLTGREGERSSPGPAARGLPPRVWKDGAVVRVGLAQWQGFSRCRSIRSVMVLAA